VTQLRPSLLMWKPRHCKKCKVFGHKCHTQASKKVKGDALPVASTAADPTLTTSPAPLEPSMQAPQEPQELGLNNIKRTACWEKTTSPKGTGSVHY